VIDGMKKANEKRSKEIKDLDKRFDEAEKEREKEVTQLQKDIEKRNEEIAELNKKLDEMEGTMQDYITDAEKEADKASASREEINKKVDRNSQAAKAERKKLREQLAALEQGVSEAKERVAVVTPNQRNAPPPPAEEPPSPEAPPLPEAPQSEEPYEPYIPQTAENLRDMQPSDPPTTTDEDEPASPATPPPTTPRGSVYKKPDPDQYSWAASPEPQASPDTPATEPAPPAYKSQSREDAERAQSGGLADQYAFMTPDPPAAPVTPEPATAAAKVKKAVAKTRRGSAIQQVSDALTLDTDAKSGRASVSQMRKAIEAKDALNSLNR